MPWEKSFDEAEVLEKAMLAFWRHGYASTSMKNLVASMDLHPGSIYAAFGNKKNLFRLALQRYEEQNRAFLVELEKKHTPRNAVLAIFDHMVADVHDHPDNCGCFLVNSMIDAAPKDDDINQSVMRGLAAFEAFCQRMIEKAQEIGEVRPELDAAKTARILQGLIAGARVVTRANPDHRRAQDIAEHAKDILS